MFYESASKIHLSKMYLRKKYFKNLNLAFSTYTLQKFNQIKLSALKQKLTIHHFRVYETAAYASDITVQFSLFSPVHLH